MNISVNDAFLDLSERFQPEATLSNALFSRTGALTAPVSLPSSEHNLEILNHPERPDRDPGYGNTFDAQIHSAEIRQCRMQIASAHEIDGIDATLYFDDGDFYSRAKDFKLNRLSRIRDEWGANIANLLDYLMQVMREEVEDDFMLFPVCLEFEEGDPYSDPPVPAKGIILNATEDTGGSSETFIAYSPQTETIDGVDITLPVGYAVTPFLKFHAVLKMAIEHFGYSLLNSPWESDAHLKRMVFLNNTADACLRDHGTLDYSQLLPSITATELLDICLAKGYVAYINSTAMTVRFVSIPDIINSNPAAELTSVLSSRITTFYDAGKQISLSAGTIESASPNFESYEEMWKSYRPYGDFIEWSENQFNNLSPSPNYYNIIRKSTGDYYWIKSGSYTKFRKKLSSPYFNHVPAAGEIQSFDSIEKFVAVDFPDIPGKTSGRLMPMYLIGATHYNTAVDRDGSLIEEQKQNELAATLCYAYGLVPSEKYFFGSTRCYDPAGNPIRDAWSSIDIVSATGYYGLFFREMEEFLLKGVRIEAELNMPPVEIESLDLSKSVRIKNQRYLIEEIAYQIGDGQTRARLTAWLNT
ncbi:MAG: hypothetical protein LBK58_10320 [Prevotellaceae bacterium]|jgi:hypothetical protein|nr:hypothetical protein [Prevotellaceae bacterium]